MNPYDILGVNNDVTQNELKQVYRTLVLKHHPDKGGDAKTFSDIREAYEKLKCQDGSPKKTAAKSASNSTIDILKSFLYNQINKELKDLYLTLEEMYTGKIIQINLTKFIPCDVCTTTYCETCNGSGKMYNVVQMFGIKQKLTIKCSMCSGEGYTRNCEECNGSGELPEDKNYKLKIARGCQEGDRYAVENGTIVFVIRQYKHPRFIRNDNNLVLYKSISLYEALTCTKITCKHLNSKNYIFETDKIIQNDSIYKLHSLGMPSKTRNECGDLFIRFNVLLPGKLYDEAEKHKLKTILNSSEMSFDIKDERKYCHKTIIQSNEDKLDKNLLRFIRLNNIT